MTYCTTYESKGKMKRLWLDSETNLRNTKLVTAEFSFRDGVMMEVDVRNVESAKGYLAAAGLGVEEFPFLLQGLHSYVVGHKGFYIYPENKRKAKSPGSDAIYLARSEDKMEGLLLQMLPPHSKTSRHYHKTKTETFHAMEEGFLVNANGKSSGFPPSTFVTIEPNVVHQLYTDYKPALTLLLVEGDPKGLSMDDHNYIEQQALWQAMSGDIIAP